MPRHSKGQKEAAGRAGRRASDDKRAGIEERGMVSQADMDQQPPNPKHENINPSQPVSPEKPI